eukprot:COSAG05_NODE_8253_length_722_cov_1.396469_2_plen_25_part_01
MGSLSFDSPLTVRVVDMRGERERER